MDPLVETAWEGWIRPLLLILAVLALGLAWWMVWLPDRGLGVVLLVGVIVGVVGQLGRYIHRASASRAVKLGASIVVVGAAVLAGWASWRTLGPQRHIATVRLAPDSASARLPPVGSGPSRYDLRVSATPRGDPERLRLQLRVEPARDTVLLREVELRATGPERAGEGSSRARHATRRTPRIDLGGGASVRLDPADPDRLDGPARLHLLRPNVRPARILLLSLPLLLLAGLLDARHPRALGGHATTVAAGTAAFGVLLADWAAPGRVTPAVLGAVLLGALAGTLCALVLPPLLRLLVGRAPAASTLSGRSPAE